MRFNWCKNQTTCVSIDNYLRHILTLKAKTNTATTVAFLPHPVQAVCPYFDQPA